MFTFLLEFALKKVFNEAQLRDKLEKFERLLFSKRMSKCLKMTEIDSRVHYVCNIVDCRLYQFFRNSL